jgi:glycosyltransferase involved in cell wall biosynthesis
VPLRADLSERVRFVGPDELDRETLLARADVVVLCSAGANPAPGLALAAVGAGAVPVASRLPVYEETLAEGECGTAFRRRRRRLLAAQLARLISDSALLERLRGAGGEELRRRLSWQRVVDELEEVYERSPRAGATGAATRRCAACSPAAG